MARTSRSKGLQAFTLAEGATHVAQSAKTSRAAFTLAEVLITLGIIGVVAAMTLPTLISNYQKRVYVTQLKKSVSVLSQGFTTMMGHDGVTRIPDTTAFSSTTSYIPGFGTDCGAGNILTDGCRRLREELESVFSGIQFTPCDGVQVNLLNGTDASYYTDKRSSDKTCINFPDGSMIFIYTFYAPTSRYGNQNHPTGGYSADFTIDVNGPKNPNTYGRDIFNLKLANNGVVYGHGSQTVAELNDPRGDMWQSRYWRTATSNSSKCTTEASGTACAGRVLEEDAMNY